MVNRNKPNALFWIFIMTIASALILLVYSLIQLFARQGPFLFRTNVSEILGVITSLLILLSCFLFFSNHRGDLYGMPRGRKSIKK